MHRRIFQVGDVVGGYTLERRLGVGDVADVFLGMPVDTVWGPLVGRGSGPEGRSCGPVVLKVFGSPGARGPTALRRFQRECAILRRIDHPRVARVLDVGVERRTIYVALEHIPGETLAGRLTRGPLEGGHLAAAGADLLSALSAIHRAGILHRDINPTNLVLSGGRLHVVDLGLANWLGTPTVSHDRGVRMTLAYAPPERILGRGDTAASDIYQAGLVLFEMASGQHPFPCEGLGPQATAQIARPAPSVRSIAPHLPGLLDHVLDKALRKDPAARYSDAESFLGDWRRVMGHDPAGRPP